MLAKGSGARKVYEAKSSEMPTHKKPRKAMTGLGDEETFKEKMP